MPVDINPEPEKEPILKSDNICRLIDSPFMYSQDDEQLIWQNIFVFKKPKDPDEKARFPFGGPESVVWRKYAPTDADVHSKGCKRESDRRERDLSNNKSNKMRYAGFIESQVENIRNLKNNNGHGFVVEHEPGDNQGIHHAEIHLKAANDKEFDSSTDRPELILLLKKCFGALNGHSCRN